MVMYLIPASLAPVTASFKFFSLRKVLSLTSIGKLMPAITSTLALSMMDIAPFTAVTAWLEKLRAAQKGKK